VEVRNLSTDTKHLDYIDALRGYAILGVIGVHASQSGAELAWPLRLLADQGARGVQLFFVVSSLTLMLSWRERHDGILPFYIRRLFRIAPMFWLAMVFFPIVDHLAPAIRYWTPLDVSWPNILASATFTHGFHPAAISSIVPGGWSIADEMTFYLVLPLLVATLRSWRAAAFALVISLAIGTLTYGLAVRGYLFPGQDHDSIDKFAFLWFPNQFPAFLAGLLVFHLLTAFSGRLPCNALRAGLLLSIVAMAAVPFVATALLSRVTFVMYFMSGSYSLVFALTVFCLAQNVGSSLVNAPARYVGKVSYSAYFWHFPALGVVQWGVAPLATLMPAWLQFAVMFAAGVVLTIGASSITYRFVEAPMIRLGRRLAVNVAGGSNGALPAERAAQVRSQLLDQNSISPAAAES
jgi:peptidoglycan/LPS O-acetylase OafA/YrhL